MRNTKFSRLALFGLAAISSFAFAANTVSGAIRFDATFNTSQKPGSSSTTITDAQKPADSLNIARARLDFAGDIAKNWMYNVRVNLDEYTDHQLGLDYTQMRMMETTGLPMIPRAPMDAAAVISQAYATWSGLEGVALSLGRIQAPSISSDNLYYKPYIGNWPENQSVGNLVNISGDHPGLSIAGKVGPVGYEFGVWNQTNARKLTTFNASPPVKSGEPVTSGETEGDKFRGLLRSTDTLADFDSKSLRLGYAARLTFAPKISGGNAYGIGIGYNQAPLNVPVVVLTAQSYSSTTPPAAPVYTTAAFNQLTNVAVDAAAVFGAVQVNVGYQNQHVKLDATQGYGTTTSASQIFNEDGKATAWWVEAGYLLMGDSYNFDAAKAVVSGVKLRDGQAGLEIAARFGTETNKNVMALLDPVGHSDFSATSTGVATSTAAVIGGFQPVSGLMNNGILALAVDNDDAPGVDGTQIVDAGTVAYQSKSTGFVFNINYYVNNNAAIKAEFEQRHNKFERMFAGSTWLDSVNNKSVSTIRLRAEFMF